MKRTPYTRPRTKNTPPTQDSLYTGGKAPEYAVFYNIAYWWISDFLKSLYPYKEKYENTDNYSPYIDRFINEGKEGGQISLPDSAYIKLRDYLWKGYHFDKNRSGLELTENDRRLIHKMLAKLSEVRNFHSHYWHDNANLEFDTDLSKWIDYLHDYALNQLQKEYPWEVDEYRKKRESKSLFDRHDGKSYISQDGRNFFLSFFLKKGEMTRFMQQRKGCKRNDKPEFKLKHHLYRYYTHRDGATKNRCSIEETAFSGLGDEAKSEILNARQLYKMLSYLNDVPCEIIDKNLFPLYHKQEKVENEEQMLAFLEEQPYLKKCAFSLLENKHGELVKQTLAFTFETCNFSFEIRVAALHKLLLDIIREPKREADFYVSLNTFSTFRTEFPGKLDAFVKGESSDEEMNDYYNYKLKTNDYTRGKLGQIIESVNSNTRLDYRKIFELKDLASTKAIELSYYNFYFERDQKPRQGSQFIPFAVNYLIDQNICPDWEWLMEKFEPEAVEKKVEGRKQVERKVEQVIKRVKIYADRVPEGYRLSLKNQQVLVRMKNKPEMIFGLGENAMRNLIMVHFQRKPINQILGRLCDDLEKIKQAGKQKEALAYDQLGLLCSKTMPRFLRMMMRDESIIQTESIGHATTRAKDRITRLMRYFDDVLQGKVKLNRKQINTQLIRCYKYFDWKYDNNSAYKFLRQNEYQLMSIYHYSLAKEDLSHTYLVNLRRQLFVDIKHHLPQKLDDILRKEQSLDALFERILKETMSILEYWNDHLAEMNHDEMKDCFSKLSIKLPQIPVPDAAIQSNLRQMVHLPLLLHPALILKAFNYPQKSNIFADFRNDPINSKGLLEESYHYQAYLELLQSQCPDFDKISHKLIGELNNLKTLDTLIWKMTKQYLDTTTSSVLKEISFKLINDNQAVFKLNQLHDTLLPVFQSAADIESPYRVLVKFKQLGDYMLITGKPLEKLALQLLNRYPNGEDRERLGLMQKEGYYQIDYSLIKQEMDRVYHESLMLTDFIFQWEKTIVDAIDDKEKQKLINHAQEEGKRAHLKFPSVCRHAQLDTADTEELCSLRNSALHAKIPEGFAYHEKIEDDRIRKMLNITTDMLKKYEKKDSYYEAEALLLNT